MAKRNVLKCIEGQKPIQFFMGNLIYVCLNVSLKQLIPDYLWHGMPIIFIEIILFTSKP